MSEDFDLGARLRQLRVEAGISQRALALRADMPGGHVSMIENGKSNPSVQTLRKLGAALGVTMSEFFEPDPGLPQKVFFKATDQTTDPKALRSYDNGKITGLRLGETRFLGMEFEHRKFQPGACLTPPTGMDVAEAGFVISGTLEVTIGAQTEVLGPGDAYFVPAFASCQFKNEGDQLVDVIMAHPASDQRGSVSRGIADDLI